MVVVIHNYAWRISKQGENYDHAVETLDIHSHDMINIACFIQ